MAYKKVYRIAFILDRFPVLGGVERITINQSNAFYEDGHNVWILSREGYDIGLLKQLKHGINLITFKDRDFYAEKIVGFVRNYGFDMIINQGAYSQNDKIFFKLKQICNIPIISTYHNDPLSGTKEGFRSMRGFGFKSTIKRLIKPIYIRLIHNKVKRHYKNMCHYSSKVVLLCDSYIDDMLEFIGNNKLNNNLIAIPNFINNSIQKRSISFRKREVIFVGRLVEAQKRVLRILPIWKIVNSKHSDWTLRIIGNGPELKMMKTQSTDLRLFNVSFEGERTDVEQIMSQASIIILTSDFEGLPMVLIEAMSEGCVPIIYDSFSAAKYIIKSGVNGYLIPNGDAIAFASCIAELMLNSAKWSELSNQAIESSKRFKRENILPLWLNLFDEIVG